MSNCRHRLTEKDAFLRLESGLRMQGARITAPRRSILKAALEQKSPFSADALRTYAKGDLATIYRTLTLFEELGLLNRIDVGGDSAIYEIAAKDQSHHHHYFVCRKCRFREPMEICSFSAEELSLKKRGFSDLRHRVEFSGLCPKCTAGKKNERK
ncbi:MAG: transcriptional repressor [Bdellovibrionaceae bacterium]|nr:transcriptional repressor [Pseudobdellovibrionaceae bacterium]